jgi:hypothetical protein
MIPLFKRKKLSTHARINVEANMISGKSRRELLELQVREQDLKQKIGFLRRSCSTLNKQSKIIEGAFCSLCVILTVYSCPSGYHHQTDSTERISVTC